MKSAIVKLRHDIEQEWIGVVIQRFVIEEELGQEAEILSVAFVLPSVDFKERDCVLTIDFIARRVSEIAFGDVALQALSTLSVF